MKRSNSINKILTTVTAIGLALVANHAFGQVSLSGGAYTQNFNSLPSTAIKSNVWVNNTTLSGWYCEAVGVPPGTAPAVFGSGVECINIIANSGAGTAAAFYSSSAQTGSTR